MSGPDREGRRRQRPVVAPSGIRSFDFEAARRAVERWTRRTPLLREECLSERLGTDVLLKLENLQVTGSFKVRGAAARLAALSKEEVARGVVACSSGNHGRAVAHIAGRMGIAARVFVPMWVDPVKLGGIRDAGCEAVLAGDTFDEAEALAIEAAEQTGSTYVSAYDDPWVIAGQGTIGLELVAQLGGRPPGSVIAPLSGGGLIGGIAAALRAVIQDDEETEIVAASASRAAVMLESLAAGRPVELPEEETVASALAGGIGLDNRHSFALVRALVHRHVRVEESEVRAAVRYAVERLRLVVEGGGAVALAALLTDGALETGALPGPIVVVVSGGNISADLLTSILAEGSPGG